MQEPQPVAFTRADVRTLWIRTFVVAAACAIAFGWGLYAVSPGGEYTTYGIEKHSYNPSTYRWFFQSINSALVALGMGTLVGGLCALAALPVAAIVGTVLLKMEQLNAIARAWIESSWWVIAPLAAAFWSLGLLLTLVAGENPGICC